MRKTDVGSRQAVCRRTWLAAVAVAIGVTGAASGQTIIHGPVQNPANGHWYGIMSPSGWTDAQTAAEAYGGHLATVADASENNFIQNDVGLFFLADGRLWIGFTDEGRAVNDFAWVTGEPVTFTNWNFGEPNNAGAGEDATELLLSSGLWNDNADNPPVNPAPQGVIEFEEAVGACDVGGNCSIMTPAACAAALGVYSGDFTLCSGACCLPDSTCVALTAPECLAQDGAYQGDGTDCGTVTCPDLSGACCLSDGFCIQVVESACSDSGGNFRGVGTDCGTECIPPANDACASAELIASLPATISGTTELASLDFEPQCGANSSNTAPGVWYRLPGTGHEVTATLCANANPAAGTNYDAQVSVYTDCGLLTCIEGSDDDSGNGCFGAGGTVTFCTSLGTDYLILVHGFGGATGEFTMVVTDDASVDCTVPANDDCFNAQAVSLPALVSGNTTAASTDTAPACPFAPSDGGVWYSVTGTGTEITATMCPNVDPNGMATSNFDTQISVYTDCGALACVIGNDDSCGTGSSVAFDTVAGQQYLILVHGFGTGSFSMAIFETPSGACCFNDGTCVSDSSPAECASMGGSFNGDGSTCDGSCPNLHADDVRVALAYNFNGIVHAPSVPTEQLQPDNANGFRAISDRALRIIGGVAPDFAAAGATRTYNVVTQSFVLDMVHLGNRNETDGGNWAFDAFSDGDNIGVQPTWLTNVDQSTVSNPVNPGIVMDASSSVGVVYHASNGGTDFNMTLEFSDLTSVTVLLNASDWFANNNPVPALPDFGVESQNLLAGPLSAGDGFPGAGDIDNGSDSSPLNLIEAVVSTNSLLNGLGFDMTGKTLTGITFSNRTNLNAAVGIYAATAVTSAGATPISLALNFNGIAHSAGTGGEQNMADNLNGYRSIGDRGLLFLDNHAPALPSADLGYDMVETEFITDIVFLGSRTFDVTADGDNIGVMPAWMASNPITSSTTTIAPGIGVGQGTRFGILYHASNGGASFDMTLGFGDGSSVTVRPTAPDWFANNNPVAGAPGSGIVSQRVLPGPLSGGDGFLGAGAFDLGTPSSPLNIVEAIVSRDEILADLGVDIAGRTLTSVTFNNKVGGGLAIFAMSVDGAGGAVCVCEFDDNPAQVNVFDLLAYLDLWFADAAGADIDGVAGVDVFDLLAFLDCWFPASAGAPCP